MRTIGTNHAVNSQYHLNINRAISLENAKRYEDAKAFYKQAFIIARQFDDENNMNRAKEGIMNCYLGIAYQHESKKNYEKAKSSYEEASKIAKEIKNKVVEDNANQKISFCESQISKETTKPKKSIFSKWRKSKEL